jgi:hypothetical protein
MFDSNLNVLGSERSEIHGFEHHRLFRRLRYPGFGRHRISSPEMWVGLVEVDAGRFRFNALAGSLRERVDVDMGTPFLRHDHPSWVTSMVDIPAYVGVRSFTYEEQRFDGHHRYKAC